MNSEPIEPDEPALMHLDRYKQLDEALANPAPEEIAAMAALGRQPGAVGYNDAGQLVRVRADGSHEILAEAGDGPA